MPTDTTLLKDYELTFILGERATAEDGTAKVADLTKYIASLGGEVTKEEHWGRRELAYVIKRNRSGFYVTLWFKMPAAGLKSLDQELRFDESIIRSLVTIAYTEAEAGSLYPVVEEEKPEKTRGDKGDVKSTAEEELRRSSSAGKKEEFTLEDNEILIPEEERLKQLDETLDALLKDEE